MPWRYTPATRPKASKRPPMTDLAVIARQLVELRMEHRDLDAAIERLVLDRHNDELQLKRLKKRKLRLKDMIAHLESQLIPDQPA